MTIQDRAGLLRRLHRVLSPRRGLTALGKWVLAPRIAELEKAHEARVAALLHRASENKKKAIKAARESSTARVAATRRQLQAKLKA
ncbi:MAG TPA: hypothetical protein VFD26_07335, partial [Methyloceanibacter sp.]|nr:hypothetical protein [Methyloceanibacter sp.]